MKNHSFTALLFTLCLSLPAIAQEGKNSVCAADCRKADMQLRLDQLSDSGRKVEITLLKSIPLKKGEHRLIFAGQPGVCTLVSDAPKAIVVKKGQKMLRLKVEFRQKEGTFKMEFLPVDIEPSKAEYRMDCVYADATAEYFAKALAAHQMQLNLETSHCESQCGQSVPSDVHGQRGEQTL